MTMSTEQPVVALEARGLTKTYLGGDGGTIAVLERVDLSVARREMVAIVGASGAGKSTLLHLLGALDRPSAGDVLIGGQALASLTDDEVSALRNRTVGFVFQFHHLLREFTALENVMMPLRIAGVAERIARERAMLLLERVGLAGRVQHRPAQLSGGEQQRTAVARALAVEPQLLLADEPSGNLDHMNSERLHDLFAELTRELEIAMVVVTHNGSLAARADRVLELEDARLTELRRGPDTADGAPAVPPVSAVPAVPGVAIEAAPRVVSPPAHPLLETPSTPRAPSGGEP
jgi:lipoprotein-releasing system ATP-binding protein